MRVVVDALVGAGDAHFAQQRQGPVAGGGGAQIEMRPDRFDELPANRVERVEAGQRVLKNGADLAAADPPHRLVGQIVDPPAGQ